jgi:hypothetical protein
VGRLQAFTVLERRCRPPAFKQIGTYSKRGLLRVSKWVADVAEMIATVAGLLDLCMQTVCRACGFVTVTYCMCRWAPASYRWWWPYRRVWTKAAVACCLPCMGGACQVLACHGCVDRTQPQSACCTTPTLHGGNSTECLEVW